MNPLRLDCFVERPELEPALDSAHGVLIVGKKGIGKSAALIRMVDPRLPAVVIRRGFRSEDVDKLLQRRVRGPYQLVWDDIPEKRELFADLVEKLMEVGDPVRVLCSMRSEREGWVRERLRPDFWNRAGIGTTIRLQELQLEQAAAMCDAVAEALELQMDTEARERFAEHVVQGDAGPLFAVAMGLLLADRVGQRIRAGDVVGLPEELVAAWRQRYEGMRDLPHAQSLLHCLRFLHQIHCPLRVELSELLYTEVLGRSSEDFRLAVGALSQSLWLSREDGEFSCHDVSMEGVPASEDRFRAFAQFARAGESRQDLEMGLLRGSLSLYYYGQIAPAADGKVRASATATAVGFGKQAIETFRACEHLPHLGSALSNTSNALGELAALETSREGRANWLQKAIDYVEEAIALYRDLGLQANVATSLNNASTLYSELAALETSREGRANWLQKAIDYVEEAIRIRRDLGLQADIAMSLGTANIVYRGVAATATDTQDRTGLIRKGLACIEEAVGIFRTLGIARYLALALRHAVITYIELGEIGAGELLEMEALCAEGETLSTDMGDEDGRRFFEGVRQQLPKTR
jgi:hypothetical protein